jgi:hypothetical protein
LAAPQFDRDEQGRLRYTWKHGAPAVGTGEQADFVKRGLLKEDEGYLQLRDVETGKRVLAHGGSVNWNQYRNRWVMIAVEMGGSTSLLGEVWYAEAERPEGPWLSARKVVTHDKYSFYNPRQHAFLDREGGRFIYFEGTYTSSFSGSVQTPRYDYNQIMYKLDLADERLRLDNTNERHQAFDHDPQWDTRNNRPAASESRAIVQDFGFSPTTHCNDIPGEIGGLITPAAEPAYYAKTLRTLTFHDRFSASGKLVCADGAFHALLGFFNGDTIAEWRTPNTVALRLNGRGDRFFTFVEYATSKWRAGGDSPRPFAMRKNKKTGRDEFEGFRSGQAIHEWSLAYDPDGNSGNGAISATMDGETAVCNLEAGHKQDGASFNRFGLLNVVKSADTGGSLWIDELTINGAKEDLTGEPDWRGFENRRKYATTNVRPLWDCGFSATNLAGGRNTGEIGGRIFRGDCRYVRSLAYYADRLEPLSLDKPLHASGTVALTRGVSDSTVLLGFFHDKESVRVNESQKSGLPRSFWGIAVDGPSRDGFYFSPALRVGDDPHFFDFGNRPPVIMPDGKSHKWDLRYDPAAGAHGRVSLTFDGQTVALDLTENERAAGARFNRFGFVSTWVDGNAQSIYLDDLTYTWRQR